MRQTHPMLAGLAAAAALVAVAPVEAQPLCSSQVVAGQFEVNFIGVAYSPGSDTSEFEYCVTNLGGKALSHWVLEACFEPAALLACSPAPCFFQVVDPTTGVTGVKFDDTTTERGETDCFSFTLAGDWTLRLEGVIAALKASTEVHYGEICGPGCSAPFCGDGIVGNTPGETCDPPGVDGCRDDCTFCGDGVTDPSEECDDGNAVDDDACSNDCTVPPECGDGEINQPGETCDPPGVDGCRDDCTFCGDGVVDPSEQCDDGNDVDDDACRNDCTQIETFPECGDGEVNQPGETCDPPGVDGCRDDCTFCGDGVVNGGEACDDGNDDDADLCRNDCTPPIEMPTLGDGARLLLLLALLALGALMTSRRRARMED